MAKRGNSEGSIYKRKDGRWAGALTLTSGRRRHLYGKTRVEVARRLTAALRERELGLPVPSERLTVAQFLVQWLGMAQPTIRPRTAKRYGEFVRLHITPTLGRTRLSRLGPRHVQELYTRKLQEGLSAASVRQLHAVLHRALEQAVRWGLVGRNAAHLVDPPRVVRQEMRALTAEESWQLLNAARGDRLAPLYFIAMSTGMRQGELLALRWQNIDLARGSAQIRATLQRTSEGFVFAETKTARSRRQVFLSPLAVNTLKAHRLRQIEERLSAGPLWDARDLVFCNTLGRPIEAGNLLRRNFWPLLERAGLPRLRFHDLRHTAATLLLAEGANVKIVQELLGHSSIAVTLDVYAHAIPALQREAVDSLDRVLAGVS